MDTLTNVMVDIETLSTTPQSVIRSISFVAFSLGREESLEELQKRVLTLWVAASPQIDMGREIDEDTLSFWDKQFNLSQPGSEARQNVEWVLGEHPEDMSPEDCLDVVTSYIQDISPNGLIYSRGSNFDFPIIESLCEQTGRPLPWSTWKQTCSKSIIRFVCEDSKEIEASIVGGLKSNHSSGFDVCVEIMKLQAVYAALRGD